MSKEELHELPIGRGMWVRWDRLIGEWRPTEGVGPIQIEMRNGRPFQMVGGLGAPIVKVDHIKYALVGKPGTRKA